MFPDACISTTARLLIGSHASNIVLWLFWDRVLQPDQIASQTLNSRIRPNSSLIESSQRIISGLLPPFPCIFEGGRWRNARTMELIVADAMGWRYLIAARPARR